MFILKKQYNWMKKRISKLEGVERNLVAQNAELSHSVLHLSFCLMEEKEKNDKLEAELLSMRKKLPKVKVLIDTEKDVKL